MKFVWPINKSIPFLDKRSLYVYERVEISILIMGDASGIKGYDRRKPELSNALLYMKQDTTSTE